jgi:tetratricopeptide (TPR) repeat protein
MLQGFSNLIGEGVPGSYPGARNALVNNCVNPDLVNMGQIFFEGTSVAAVDYGLNQISDSRSNSKLIKHPIYEPAEPDTSDTTYYMSWYRARANYWGTTDLTEISSRIEHPNVALLSPVLTAAVACPSIGGPTNPNETPSLSLLRQGWLLELAGSFEAAISRYDSIGKYYPTSKEVPAALVRISKCQNLNGLTWPAIRTYFRHMADTTSDPIIKMSARNTAAWCYVEMNQMDSARLEFQNVIDIATKNYDVVYNSLGKLMTELDEEDWGSITGVKAERDKASSLDEERDEQHALQVYSVKLANVLSRLDSILMNGAGAGDVLPAVPTEFRLYQNFPNPFNPNTEIRFDLPEAVKVQLKIFNVLGQEVATLVDELRPAGAYQILWDSQNSAGSVVSSGVYIYQIKAGNFIDSKKMVLLR